MARITRGDEGAFWEIYRRHSAAVLGLLVRMLRDRAAAEDLLQEVFLKLWERRAALDPGAGSALRGFLGGAIRAGAGAHPNVQGWYLWLIHHLFLPAAPGMSYLVSAGEFAVGIALILGLFTGIAAFFGGFMNANYLLAGTVSTNPALFILATLLVLAWRVSGYWGIDAWLLPALGVPGYPGKWFRGAQQGRV